MRKAVTFLQSCHQLSGLTSTSTLDNNTSAAASSLIGNISATLVADVSGRVSAREMQNLWQVLRTDRFDALREVVTDTVAAGHPMTTVLQQLLALVVSAPASEVSDLDKALICEKIAEVSHCQWFTCCIHVPRGWRQKGSLSLVLN